MSSVSEMILATSICADCPTRLRLRLGGHACGALPGARIGSRPAPRAARYPARPRTVRALPDARRRRRRQRIHRHLAVTAALSLTETMYRTDGGVVQHSRNLFLPGRLDLHVVRELYEKREPGWTE